jgi:hypothetical protein
MLPAIGFNNQPAFLAHEVGYEWANRLLATKLHAVELAVAQHVPKLALCIGQFTTQALSLGERLAGVARHALTLPPLRGSFPLPQGERG